MGNGADQSRETTPLNPGDQAAPGSESTGETICRECRGSGSRDGRPCETCGGTGRVTQAIGGV